MSVLESALDRNFLISCFHSFLFPSKFYLMFLCFNVFLNITYLGIKCPCWEMCVTISVPRTFGLLLPNPNPKDIHLHALVIGHAGQCVNIMKNIFLWE